jgi:hypothetical protein
MSKDHLNRSRAVERFKQTLIRSGAPRLQMSAILLLTGATGLLLSFLFLHMGLTRMLIRYPVAILLAYCLFLYLLRVWLHHHRSRMRDSSVDFNFFDLLDIGRVGARDVRIGEARFKFGGGDSGGAGAARSFGESVAGKSSENSPKSLGGISFDMDEGVWLIVLPVIAIACVFVGFIYVVYSAPAIMAEILLDGFLIGGLYKGIKKVDAQYWLQGAIRRTWLPLLAVIIIFSIAGAAIQNILPDAQSFGDVWRYISTN